jgi:hypothetical protein
MKYLKLLLILLSIPTTAWAQLVPGKELGFAQIAIGGGYETVLNLTNRGTATYNGTLTLWPTDRSRPFPALVNDSVVPPSGQTSITLNPGATASLRITSGDRGAGILTGFATVKGNNRQLDNLLDGNLTYYVKSADGAILDSVGVAPSKPILQSVIPFDDFQTVALALADYSPGNATATVQLTLFDDSNVQIGTLAQTLGPNQHLPRFLSELFPGINVTKGRVEITSNIAILGTALTFVKGGQASSLPFLLSTKMYEIKVSLPTGENFTSHAYAYFDQGYLTGYTFDVQNGVPQAGTLDPFTGLVNDNGDLEILSFEGSNEISAVVIPKFNPQAVTQTGTFNLYTLSPGGAAIQGTVTLTAIK